MTTIIFRNNTVLEVEQNGNNYITDSKPVFPDDMSGIVIRDDQETQFIKNGMVLDCYAPDDRYWFTIIEKPENEVLRGQILDLECIISDLLEMM